MPTTAGTPQIHPVILAGGSGVRLWPLSRPWQPKPFVRLAGERTLFQQTVVRLSGSQRFSPPLIVCNRMHRFFVSDQLVQVGISPTTVVLEPVGRNTAPAACIAALLLAQSNSDALLMLAPSDHFISDRAGFLSAVDKAARAAADGWIVTFGARPERAETGYGYIQKGDPLPGHDGSFSIAQFVEKPDAATAKSYAESGRYAWNCGMFVASAGRLVEEMERCEPAILRACRDALQRSIHDGRFQFLDEAAFADQPDLAFDRAVMERTSRGAVVPIDVGWSDVGSWDALYEVSGKDESGNVAHGPVIAFDSHNNFLHSESLPIATLGLDDFTVIATQDALLVCPRSRSQDLARLVDALAADPSYATLVRQHPHDKQK